MIKLLTSTEILKSGDFKSINNKYKDIKKWRF